MLERNKDTTFDFIGGAFFQRIIKSMSVSYLRNKFY